MGKTRFESNSQKQKSDRGKQTQKYKKNNGEPTAYKKVGRKRYESEVGSSVRKRQSSLKLAPDEFVVDSVSAFKEYLRFSPSSIVEVRCSSKMMDKVQSIVSSICLRPVSFKISCIDPQDQEEGEVSFIMRVRVKTWDLDDLIKYSRGEAKSLVVAMDHINDPRNLGALIRTASFFGVKYIIIPEYRQVPITDSVVATSMGGLSLVKVVGVVNLSQALKKLKEEGYWILGTAMDGEDYKKVVGFYDKVVLVMGSEDRGISQGVRNLCDRNLSIISSAEQKIDSLNVSVAGGILISEFSR